MMNLKANSPATKTMWHFLHAEWKLWSFGAIFSFALASLLMSGWPSGLVPNTSYPFVYAGDGLSHAWMVQRVLEGWVFDNQRSGYPFGSNFLDYPGSDSGNFLIFKMLGLLGIDWAGAINIYFLLSFSVVFIAAYSVMRYFGLGKLLAWSGALLFAFIPFHIQRLGHLFYAWYFVVPFFFYLALRVFEGHVIFSVKKRKVILVGLLCIGVISLSSFGVYYALFGAIVISVAAVAGFAKKGDLLFIRQGAILVALLTLGVLLNLAPNFSNNLINGKNPEVAQRLPAESEIYALKLRQLILPRFDHRAESLASVTEQYSISAMAGYYEWSVPLGFVGALGLLLTGAVIVMALAGRRVDYRIRLLALLTWVLFLFGTIGGLGALFAGFVSPSIRGWDRISIFIGFGAITGFLFVYQRWIQIYDSMRFRSILSTVSVGTFLMLSVYDQNVAAPVLRNESTRLAYERDRNFVRKIEESVPPSASIYQLPYIAFPEEPSRFRLFSYEPAAGFLHSRSLMWSWGGMKGREGDLFYRALAKEPIEKQFEVIKNLGFAGIYLDKRGFEDNGQALVESITTLLGVPPSLMRSDGEVVFFKMDRVSNISLRELNGPQIMQKAGYVVDKLGKRYAASWTDGIDFMRADWPEFVRDINGLSVHEKGGRWSDANIAPTVRIEFYSVLPQNFTLVLTAFPFLPATDQDVVLKIGSQSYRWRMSAGINEFRVPVSLRGEQVTTIDFLPPNPTSPKQLGISADGRKLGIGFVKLRIEPNVI